MKMKTNSIDAVNNRMILKKMRQRIKHKIQNNFVYKIGINARQNDFQHNTPDVFLRQ